ncbi:MAG: hypothetical protein ABNH00_08605 [Dokdonia sp.]|jgi:hypothetical protein|nr:hypothetical protein [Cytophagaceae bacterium]
MNKLQDSRAVKLINKLISDVEQNGIITNTVVEDLKALRPYTITEELPLLAKATRLSAEHINEYGTFAIGMPEEESLEEEEATIPVEGEPKDSLHYFLCLIRDIDKSSNEEELRYYVNALNEY